MAQHKDATPIPCKVEINNYTLNAKAQPPWATPISKNVQHKSAMLWSKAQHTGAMPVGVKYIHKKSSKEKAQCTGTMPRFQAQHKGAMLKVQPIMALPFMRLQPTVIGRNINKGKKKKEKSDCQIDLVGLIRRFRRKTKLKKYGLMGLWSKVWRPHTSRVAYGLLTGRGSKLGPLGLRADLWHPRTDLGRRAVGL